MFPILQYYFILQYLNTILGLYIAFTASLSLNCYVSRNKGPPTPALWSALLHSVLQPLPAQSWSLLWHHWQGGSSVKSVAQCCKLYGNNSIVSANGTEGNESVEASQGLGLCYNVKLLLGYVETLLSSSKTIFHVKTNLRNVPIVKTFFSSVKTSTS